MTSTRPTLVFIHGFLDAAAAWAGAVAALGDHAGDALCLDLPGMGKLVGEPGPFSLDTFAEAVVARTRSLGRPVVLVGHSMGAQIAELAAGRLGEQVRALVLLTPMPLQGTGLPADAMAAFHALGGNPGAQRDMRRHLGPGLDRDKLEALSRLGDGVEAASVGAIADIWNQGHALGAQRTQFAGPVLLIRGESDAFITPELFAHAVVPRFHEPALASIGSAGHWPHVEQPHAFATVLREFLATLDAASAPQGWTRAFEQKSAAAFADAFAADIVLEASVLAKPVVGAEQVKTVMGAASKIYEALEFTHEAMQGLRTYLEWEAQAFGGEKLCGITILTKNADGKIVRAAIHHRPLGSALKLSTELGRRLQGQVDASHFYGVQGD
jgi:pimeloyl-ACP methyl ester carboxylesterase